MDRVKSVPVCLAVCKREMRREGRISKRVHHQHHRGQGVLPQAGIHSTTIQLELPGSGGRGNLETCQLRCTSSGEFEANAECLENGCCWERAAVTRRRKCKKSSNKISLWTRDDSVSKFEYCINLLTWNLLFALPWIYEKLKLHILEGV